MPPRRFAGKGNEAGKVAVAVDADGYSNQPKKFSSSHVSDKTTHVSVSDVYSKKGAVLPDGVSMSKPAETTSPLSGMAARRKRASEERKAQGASKGSKSGSGDVKKKKKKKKEKGDGSKSKEKGDDITVGEKKTKKKKKATKTSTSGGDKPGVLGYADEAVTQAAIAIVREEREAEAAGPTDAANHEMPSPTSAHYAMASPDGPPAPSNAEGGVGAETEFGFNTVAVNGYTCSHIRLESFVSC